MMVFFNYYSLELQTFPISSPHPTQKQISKNKLYFQKIVHFCILRAYIFHYIYDFIMIFSLRDRVAIISVVAILGEQFDVNFVADPGEARGCSSNTSDINSLIK